MTPALSVCSSPVDLDDVSFFIITTFIFYIGQVHMDKHTWNAVLHAVLPLCMQPLLFVQIIPHTQKMFWKIYITDQKM